MSTYLLGNLCDLAWACIGFAIAFAITCGTIIGIVAYIRSQLSW